ncbi:MAG: hypothetical protein OXD49_13755, partial [Candidatus Poribacteria bacterium]|nr:hypothetical protein [Candidatus Poribacteria bacterium]
LFWHSDSEIRQLVPLKLHMVVGLGVFNWSDETFDRNFGITSNIKSDFVGIRVHVCKRIIGRIAVSKQRSAISKRR